LKFALFGNTIDKFAVVERFTKKQLSCKSFQK